MELVLVSQLDMVVRRERDRDDQLEHGLGKELFSRLDMAGVRELVHEQDMEPFSQLGMAEVHEKN